MVLVFHPQHFSHLRPYCRLKQIFDLHIFANNNYRDKSTVLTHPCSHTVFHSGM
nr:MAG TPA: hypothetical protein [Caudoviricetes sp.]